MRNIPNTDPLVNCRLDFTLSACTFLVMPSMSNKKETDQGHMFMGMKGWLVVKMGKYLINMFSDRSGIFKISLSHNLSWGGNIMPGIRKIM